MKNPKKTIESNKFQILKLWFEKIFAKLEKTDKKISTIQNHVKFIWWLFASIAIIFGFIFGFDAKRLLLEGEDNSIYTDQLTQLGYELNIAGANKALKDSNGSAIILFSMIGIKPDTSVIESVFIHSLKNEINNMALNSFLEEDAKLSRERQSSSNIVIRHSNDLARYVEKQKSRTLTKELFCEGFPEAGFELIGDEKIISKSNCISSIDDRTFLEKMIEMFIIFKYSEGINYGSVPLSTISEPINPNDILRDYVNISIKFGDTDFLNSEISSNYFKSETKLGSINPSSGPSREIPYQIFFEFPDGDWFPQFYKFPIDKIFGIDACPDNVRCPHNITYLEYNREKFVIQVD